MINFKTSGKKVAALALTTLIMSACSTQIATNTSPDNNAQIATAKLTPAAENIEKQKAAYESWLKGEEQRLQEPSSYNVLTSSDFQTSFDTKANLSIPNPTGLGNAAVYVGIKLTPTATTSTYYTLTYEFMRKLRLALQAASIDNLLTSADYTKIASNTMIDVDGDTITTTDDQSNYKPTVSEAAFLNMLKTMDAVDMPNFLQGFDAAKAETNAPYAAGDIAVNPGQVPDGYTLTNDELSFISNARSVPIRNVFYQTLWDQIGPVDADADASPYILTKGEYDAIKLDIDPDPAVTQKINTTELAFLNGINNQVTAFNVVLLDGADVQNPIDVEVGYGNNQAPGVFDNITYDQTALNLIQNIGVVNRNVEPLSVNTDLVLQAPALTTTKHPAGTNYAPGAVFIAAQLLLQGAVGGAPVNNSATSFDDNFGYSVSPGQYSDFVTTPALYANPVAPNNEYVSFNNFHSIMRKFQEDYIGTKGTSPAPATETDAAYAIRVKAGAKFTITGTNTAPVLNDTEGLGLAFANAPWNTFIQTALVQVTTTSIRNMGAIIGFLSDTANINETTGLGHKRGIYVPCTRSAAGSLSFSSTSTINHAVLVKYEVIPGVGNVLFVYDPGMPNNPLIPIASNYRPMTDSEKISLYASPIRLVGLSTY